MRAVIGLLSLAVLVLAVPLSAATGLTGRILDKVTCKRDETQAYALYVPSNYTPDRKWPVIFCFDPGARGRVPVERLQAAAERYGYVVAGSLNSRNGAWTANVAAIQAMVHDVESHLAIDGRRIYTAGLSGGARVATQVAISGLAKGVIACSAGFPASDDGMPASIPFAFFGTAGSEDFNHGELWRLDENLESRKVAHRIVFFTGGHEWASVALLTEAVEWLELQAMRAGTRAKDAQFVAAQWRLRLAAVPAEAGLARWRGLKSLAADFKGLSETADAEKEAKALGASREVKDAIKAERRAQQREDDLAVELIDLANGGSAARIKKMAADLRAKAGAPEDSAERQMVRRVIAGFGSSGRDATRTMFADGDYAEAAALLELLVEFHPGQSRTLYDLARARAGAGDRKLALEALTAAADAGMSDAARVESDKLFAKVRGDAAYLAVLAKMRANPPEPVGRGRDR
jgi:poly(3-hydroxybutyrate) depolymerase